MNAATLRVAAAQVAAKTADVNHNLNSLSQMAEDAAQKNADVIVFPELFLSGYNAGSRFSEVAEESDGTIFMQVAALAKRLKIAICYGYPERADAKMFNSAQLVSAEGRSIANHRKTQLYGAYEREWFTAGEDHLSSVSYHGFILSTLICYEIEFPEPARANALNGANVILVPTATTEANNPEQVAQLMVRARAAENNLYVVYVNHASGEDGIEFNGSSLVVGPLGTIHAAASGSSAQLLITDIEQSRITEVSEVNPYLSDVRKDLFLKPISSGD